MSDDKKKDALRSRGQPPPLHREPGKVPFGFPTALPIDLAYFINVLPFGYLDVLIQQRGIRTELTTSVACPCTLVDELGGKGYPAPNCVSCSGLGVAFANETTKEFRALVSGVSYEGKHIPEGHLTEGQVRISIPSGITVGIYDRIIFPEAIVPIRFMRRYDANDGGFILPYQFSDCDTMIAKGANPKDPLIALTKGVDYTIDPARRLVEFPHDGKVTHNMVVAGTMLGQPAYLVSEVPQAFRGMMSSLENARSQFNQLPKFVIANRVDLILNQLYKESRVSKEKP